MPLETEIKFALDDPLALRGTLQTLAEHCQGPVFEENLVLDTPDGRLAAAGMLLRLRRDCRCVLTVKRPPAKDQEGSEDLKVPNDMKVMEEWDVQVGDFETTRALLAALGYVEAFCYEKVRETWRMGRVLVCLDRVPFGFFAEIEGGAEDIREAAGKLGLAMDRGLTRNYHQLNLEYRRGLGLAAEDGFVFPPEFRENFFQAKDELNWLKGLGDF